MGNRQLVNNVRADLDKAAKLQKDRTDLASRLEALEVLQDRIEQLQATLARWMPRHGVEIAELHTTHR